MTRTSRAAELAQAGAALITRGDPEVGRLITAIGRAYEYATADGLCEPGEAFRWTPVVERARRVAAARGVLPAGNPERLCATISGLHPGRAAEAQYAPLLDTRDDEQLAVVGFGSHAEAAGFAARVLSRHAADDYAGIARVVSRSEFTTEVAR